LCMVHFFDLVGDDHFVARRQHVGVLAQILQIGVVRVIPDGRDVREAILDRDARQVLALLDRVPARHGDRCYREPEASAADSACTAAWARAGPPASAAWHSGGWWPAAADQARASSRSPVASWPRSSAKR